MSRIPAGTIKMLASTTIPAGWLACDGSFVSTTTYSRLYAVVGVTYGTGGGTFQLPDLRGEFVRGLDDMGTGARGIDVGRTLTAAQGQGTKANGLTASVPSSGGGTSGFISADHSHQQFAASSGSASPSVMPDVASGNAGKNNTGGASVNHTHTTPAHTHSVTMGAGDAETRPRNMAMVYIIKY